jgi:integrase
VPADIQHFMKLRQLYRALATTDRREAIIRARALAARTDQLFEQIRDMAKKKNDPRKVGMIVTMDSDELGLPRFRMQTEAHDTTEDKQQAFAVAQKHAEGRQTLSGTTGGGNALRPGKPFGEAVDEFLETFPKAKTKRAYRTALKQHAIPFFKAKTLISSIDQDTFAKYVKHILADKKSKHATHLSRINPVTSMFSWLYANHPKSTPILTTKKLIPPPDESEEDERDEFKLHHLRVLFENAKQYRSTEPHKFWVTVVAAFTGCRIEELAQASLQADLRRLEESDIWYFELNERADADGVKRKSMKKRNSKRLMPIHSSLVRHGFIDYLEKQKQEGATRPFELGWKPWKEPDMGTLRWAHAISKWGSRELDQLDKTGKLSRAGLKLSYFHSMRHTFATVLDERGVSEGLRSILQGQAAPGAGENSKRYSKLRRNPRFLSDIVEEHLVDYAAILDDLLADV